jgi:nucleoside-diphosphate-sugar epimerase
MNRSSLHHPKDVLRRKRATLLPQKRREEPDGRWWLPPSVGFPPFAQPRIITALGQQFHRHMRQEEIVVRRCAITGADGMIGRYLVQALRAAGVETRALLLPDVQAPAFFGDVEIVRGDVRDGVLVNQLVHGTDAVFHLAALVGRAANGVSLEAARAVNVTGTRNVLDAISRRSQARMILLSSCCVYGLHGMVDQVLDENSPHAPLPLPYDISKTEAEELVCAADPATTPWSILQIPVALGGVHTLAQPTATSLIRLARTGLSPQPMRSTVWANYVFGADVAAALVALAEHPDALGQTFIHSESVPLPTLLAWIASEFGIRSRSIPVPHLTLRAAARASPSAMVLANRRRFSNAKITRDIGYYAPFGLEYGLRETIRHYRASGLIS